MTCYSCGGNPNTWCQQCLPADDTWIAPVDKLPDVFMGDRDHLYMTPDGNFWALSPDRTKWMKVNGQGSSYKAGAGIRLDGETIVNTQPNKDQSLSVNDHSLTISNGNTVNLPNDKQNLSVSGRTLSISNGNSVTIPDDKQSLSLNGRTISITGGNSITLPEDKDTIYNDTELKRRIQAVESRTDNFVTGVAVSRSGNKVKLTYTFVNGAPKEVEFEDKDTITLAYDDSSLKARVKALEDKEDKDTILTVTGYNGIKVIRINDTYHVSGESLSNRITLLEPMATGLNNRVTALEAKPDKDEQKLSISGNNLTISGGNTVTLPIPVAQTPVEVAVSDGLTVTKAGNKYTVSSKALLDRITALERKPDNDSQKLSISGNTLSLTNGGSVTLPTPATYNDTDIKRRLTALEGKTDKDTVYNDTDVKRRLTALEGKADKDEQKLSLSGTTLSLTNGGSVQLPQTIQALSISGRNLTISRNNTVTLPDTNQPIFRIAKADISGNGSAGSTASTTVSNLMNPDGLKVGDIVQDFYNSTNNSQMGYFKVTAINGQNVTLQGLGFHETVQAPTLAQFNDLNNKFNTLKADYDRVIQALHKIVSNLQSTGAWTGGITGQFVPNRNIATGNINLFGGTADGNAFIRTNNGRTENDLAGGIS